MTTHRATAQVPETLNIQRLVSYLLDEPWHQKCDFIQDYMPPHPSKDTRPAFVVRFNDGTEYPPFLRYSRGPKQGWGWDIYGDDLQNAELAVIALSQAPAPVYVGPITFRFKLDDSSEDASRVPASADQTPPAGDTLRGKR